MPATRCRLRLTDGVTFTVTAQVETLAASVREARENGRWIEVVNDHGVVRHLNPEHVIYVEPVTTTVVNADADA